MEKATSVELDAMQRCLQLAEKGRGMVAPNPMVGCVILFENQIIGEGYHVQYGGPHAEVHAVASVEAQYQHLLPSCTIVVSLEPCSHFGKTPPCLNLLLEKGFKRIIIGSADPNPKVAGQSIARLRAEGKEVVVGVLEEQCRRLNKRFYCFHEKKRPYLVLKWAQTSDGFVGLNGSASRLLITGPESNALVHQWRSEEMAIMVGTQTALLDDPRLSVRLISGRQPARVILDRQLLLPERLHIFDGSQPTFVFHQKDPTVEAKRFSNVQGLTYKALPDFNIHTVLHELAIEKISSVLIEGGPQLLTLFYQMDLWDEIRIITSHKTLQQLHKDANGKSGPDIDLRALSPSKVTDNDTDQIRFFER